MNSIRAPRSTRHDVLARTEHLEPRLLLSAPYDFAAVGIRYGDAPSVFLTEGTLGADDSITGATRLATLAGTTDGPIDWTSLTRDTYGRFAFGTRDGFDPYTSQAGTQFIRDERWHMGGFAGYDSDGNIRDHAVMGQVFESEDFRLSARGLWNMQLTRLTDSGGVETVPLDVYFDFNLSPPYPFVLTYHFSTGDVVATKTVASYENGRAVFDTGEVFIILDDVNAAILADFDATDGIVGVAQGINGGGMGFSNPGPASGWYRGQIGVSGPNSAAHFGVELNEDGVGVADVVIQFDYNDFSGINTVINHFAIYRASDWDAEIRTPLATGSFDSGFAPYPQEFNTTLTFDNGDTLTLSAGTSHIFTPGRLESTGAETEQLWGVISRADQRPEFEGEFLFDTDANGRPIAYRMSWPYTDGGGQKGGQTVLYSFDLIHESGGGEAIVSNLISWINLGNAYGPRAFVAGVAADGDVLLWQISGDSWTFVNLTETTPGARPITGELFSTMFATSEYVPGEQFLAGFDEDGMLVVYHQAITRPYPLFEWNYVDAQRDGFDGAESFPAGIEYLTGWSTPWSAGHFAGIDQAGELWSIWWAPGMDTWRVDSLTEASNGPVLFGRPSAIGTSWDTFHISAFDADNHLIVTWWALQNDEWRTQDLTADFSGPILSPNSVTSNFSRYRTNINIAGLDTEGAARVYWWSPMGGWQIDTLSANVTPEEIPLTPWRLSAAQWGVTFNSNYDSQSLIGQNEDGDLVRLTWRSDRGPSWAFENITASSIPYI